jgi:hypothetical protein
VVWPRLSLGGVEGATLDASPGWYVQTWSIAWHTVWTYSYQHSGNCDHKEIKTYSSFDSKDTAGSEVEITLVQPKSRRYLASCVLYRIHRFASPSM